MTARMPSGDLARCVTHEADESWPSIIEIVAYWGKNGRKGKRRAIEISADQFFGLGGYGAPMTGEQIIYQIDRVLLQSKFGTRK